MRMMGRLSAQEKGFLDYLLTHNKAAFHQADFQIKEWKWNGKVGSLKGALNGEALEGFEKWMEANIGLSP